MAPIDLYEDFPLSDDIMTAAEARTLALQARAAVLHGLAPIEVERLCCWVIKATEPPTPETPA